MPYGEIRVDTITFTNGGVDTSISVSGLAASTTGNLTVTGTISGATVRATTVSGVTVTGTTVQGASGTFTSITGGTATITSGLFASGTAANPSIAIIGDANTGLYSPGADQVAISTNGTGRLFVDASGSVGVGSASNPGGAKALISNSGAEGVEIYPGFSSGINATLHYSRTGAAYVISDQRASQHVFSIDANERMRLDSSGRLGLGTSSPGNLLHLSGGNQITPALKVESAIYPIIDLYSNFGGAARNWRIAGVYNSAGTFEILNSTTAGGDPTTSRFAITSSGNVGIGTTSPATSALLHVKSSGTYGNIVADNSSATGGGGFTSYQNGSQKAVFGTSGYIVGDTSSDAALFAETGGNIRFYTNGSTTERVRITSGGAVGIGTNSVSTKLHIVSNGAGGDVWVANGSGQNCLLEMAGNGNTPQTNSALYGQDSSNNVYAGWARGAHPVLFGTNGTERGRWDSSGRFLVGTSSSLGNGIIQARANSDSSTGEGILLLAKGDAATAGQNLGQIKFTNSSGNQAAYITGIADTGWGGAGSADYPGALTFATTADGANSPTERMRITNSGKFYFNCTSDPSSSVKGLGILPNGTAGNFIASGVNATSSVAHVEFYNPNGAVGSISTSGSSTAYTTSSDYRLKENVVPLTGAIDRINQLKPSQFNFIANPDETVDGFIAHEAQAVVPECVTGEKNAVDDEGNPIYQGIDQSKLVPLLTAALQEAIAKIETLEAKVAALEAQ